MWPYIEDMLNNPTISTLVSVFVGGLITWFVAWVYYKRAGDELRAEAALLRKANIVIVYKLEHPDAVVEVRRDEAGNPIGLNISATGQASGKSTVNGVGAVAKRDS